MHCSGVPYREAYCWYIISQCTQTTPSPSLSVSCKILGMQHCLRMCKKGTWDFIKLFEFKLKYKQVVLESDGFVRGVLHQLYC